MRRIRLLVWSSNYLLSRHRDVACIMLHQNDLHYINSCDPMFRTLQETRNISLSTQGLLEVCFLVIKNVILPFHKNLLACLMLPLMEFLQ
jgi:hypothetical protein